jgi:uncharacterized protein DUF3450
MPKISTWCSRVLQSTSLAFLLGLTGTVSAAAVLDASIEEQASIDRSAATTQGRVDALADETEDLLAQYTLVVQQADRLRVYNDQLAALIRSQEEEKLSIQRQLEGIIVVEQGIIPLMLEMIDALEEFIGLDLPFQREDRMANVDRLRENMDRADLTVSEKYRQVMEAYQLEVEYGRTIYAYRGKLPGTERTVDFLQVGRILLAYQTLDRNETGFFNSDSGGWEVLEDAAYRSFIDEGLKIARKQSAPNLLMLPIHAPEAAQ